MSIIFRWYISQIQYKINLLIYSNCICIFFNSVVELFNSFPLDYGAFNISVIYLFRILLICQMFYQYHTFNYCHFITMSDKSLITTLILTSIFAFHINFENRNPNWGSNWDYEYNFINLKDYLASMFIVLSLSTWEHEMNSHFLLCCPVSL